ncbi:Hypothetical Protein LMG19145_00885 [Xanthomonas arboricola pv. fragariae]|nr:hypothetical protein [Xanthomonas arboricola]SOU09798.1 Hypothetical Protein LMG19145_00885 [Xanthomonas arboricola pv. fragariae]
MEADASCAQLKSRRSCYVRSRDGERARTCRDGRCAWFSTEQPVTGAVSLPRPRRCEFAAGPLPAHHRRTRRKYVHVGSYAASMPRKVPRRWAGKDLSRWSVVWLQAKHGVCCSDHRAFDQLSSANRVTEAAQQSNLQTFQRSDARLAIATGSFSFDHQPTSWCGVLAGCGTLGGMDAAKEPPWMDSRRVPQAVRAPRTRRAELLNAFKHRYAPQSPVFS